MNIADKIAYRAKLEPELPAIIAGGSIVTFGMLQGAVRGVAARLAEFGLAPGSLVGISIKAPARHMAVSLALMRMGLASAPFANEAALANLPELAMAIADQPFAMPGGRLCMVAGDDWFAPGDRPLPVLALPASTPCRIVMSSGTTGRPKPLLLTAATLEWQLYGVELQLTAAGHWSRGLVMMDLTASWSFFTTLATLSAGRTMCFAANAAETLRVISLYGCEYLMGSVFHLRTLVDAQRERYVPVPSLMGMTIGGSVITAQLLSDIQAMLTRRIVLGYGSAEMGCVALEIAGGDASMDGACGYVLPSVELEVIDEGGNALPPNSSGRIRIRSEFTAMPIDGSEVGPGGWFHPGDVGHVDATGRLFITGRVTELINVGGVKIAPERVEQVLLQHPRVVDAGVVGVPDGRGGDAIVAAVVADGQVDLTELSQFCAANFQAAPIARFVVLPQIPRGTTGKVVRPTLVQLVNT